MKIIRKKKTTRNRQIHLNFS
uniref:Uncharacterized protein n=1 Tax=Anguilla anguilla TaxID=7936 RepID=A0A0E9WEB0_ANGAN